MILIVRGWLFGHWDFELSGTHTLYRQSNIPPELFKMTHQCGARLAGLFPGPLLGWDTLSVTRAAFLRRLSGLLVLSSRVLSSVAAGLLAGLIDVLHEQPGPIEHDCTTPF